VRLNKKNGGQWENLVSRFLVASGVPFFRWDGKAKRFNGISGWSFVRVTPRLEGGWANVPYFFKRYETSRSNGNPHPTVMFLTSKDNGPNVEDSFVLMRLETFAPLLVNQINADPERHIRMEK
jgi:hypothetical protein